MNGHYIGRHRAPEPVDQDYNPLAPAVRQDLAPTHYANRRLPAGPDDRTGLYRTADLNEVTR